MFLNILLHSRLYDIFFKCLQKFNVFYSHNHRTYVAYWDYYKIFDQHNTTLVEEASKVVEILGLLF